jgi:hypothetical protein
MKKIGALDHVTTLMKTVISGIENKIYPCVFLNPAFSLHSGIRGANIKIRIYLTQQIIFGEILNYHVTPDGNKETVRNLLRPVAAEISANTEIQINLLYGPS